MAKTFDEIVSAVSDDIQDTSNEMKSIIGRYVNNRYRKVLRNTNFNIINYDYTVSVIAGTRTYTLPADFGHELYVIDSTNGRTIEQTTFDALGADYGSQLADTGSIEKYIIFRDDSNNIVLYLFNIPSSATTLSIPYTVSIRDNMSGTDEPVNDFADLLEIGATADAWRYKRQFSKARSLDVMFDTALDEYMWKEENGNDNLFTANKDDYNRDCL